MRSSTASPPRGACALATQSLSACIDHQPASQPASPPPISIYHAPAPPISHRHGCCHRAARAVRRAGTTLGGCTPLLLGAAGWCARCVQCLCGGGAGAALASAPGPSCVCGTAGGGGGQAGRCARACTPHPRILVHLPATPLRSETCAGSRTRANRVSARMEAARRERLVALQAQLAALKLHVPGLRLGRAAGGGGAGPWPITAAAAVDPPAVAARYDAPPLPLCVTLHAPLGDPATTTSAEVAAAVGVEAGVGAWPAELGAAVGAELHKAWAAGGPSEWLLGVDGGSTCACLCLVRGVAGGRPLHLPRSLPPPHPPRRSGERSAPWKTLGHGAPRLCAPALPAPEPVGGVRELRRRGADGAALGAGERRGDVEC